MKWTIEGRCTNWCNMGYYSKGFKPFYTDREEAIRAWEDSITSGQYPGFVGGKGARLVGKVGRKVVETVFEI